MGTVGGKGEEGYGRGEDGRWGGVGYMVDGWVGWGGGLKVEGRDEVGRGGEISMDGEG